MNTQVLEALERVLEYLWHDEKRNYFEYVSEYWSGEVPDIIEEAFDSWWDTDCSKLPPDDCPAVGHVFESMVTLRQWLDTQYCHCGKVLKSL